MLIKLIRLLIFCTGLPCSVFAQTNTTCSTFTFQKEIIPADNQNYRERILSATATSDSAIIFTGREQNSTYPLLDSGFVTKLSAQGNFIWSKKFKPPSNLAIRIFELKDKNLLMLEPYNQYDNFSISKLSSNGLLLWRKEFSELQYYITTIEDLIETNDGHLLGTGFGDFNGSLLCKFDLDGNIIWSKSYHVPPIAGGGGVAFGFNYVYKALAETADGYIFVNTYHLTNWDTQTPIHIFKVEKLTGALLWSKQIQLPGNRFFLPSMAITNNNLYFVSNVASTQNTPGLRHIAVIKTDLNGNIVNSIKTPSIKRYNYIVTKEEKILFTLSDTLNQSTGKPFAMFQLDSNLNLEWAKKYEIEVDSISSAQYRPVTIQSEDESILSLFVRRNTTLNNSFTYLIKTDKTGSSGECANENIPITILPLALSSQDFVSNIEERNYTVINQMIPMVDNVISINEICHQTSFCDSIKLTGPTLFCNLTDSLIYKVTRNTGCFSTAIWQLSDTSFGKIVVYSDSSIKIKFNKAGQVKLYATIPTNCEDIKDSLLIHISRPASSLNLGNNFGFCGDSSVTLKAGAGFKNYKWQDGSQTEDFITDTAGLYFAEVTDYCNNTFRDSILISAIAPEAIDLGNDITICKNDSVIVTAPANFLHYSWSPAYNIINANAQAANLFPANATKYFLHATKRPGCVSIDSIVVNINNLPQLNLPSDSSICQGQFITLSVSNSFAEYIWNTGETSAQINVNKPGIYVLSAKDINGCKAKDSFQLLNVYPNPLVDISNDNYLCIGQSNILSAANNNNHTWVWQDGSILPTYEAIDTGFYKVTVTNIVTGCFAADSLYINHFKPSPTDFLQNDTSICSQQSITISSLKDFTNYTWFNGVNNKSVLISQPGIYKLQVTDSYKCKGIDSIVVRLKDCRKLIYLPTAFTPNNDGLNDIFRASYSLLPEKYNINIYNRYGQIVYTGNSITKGWDGKYKGIPQNAGSFVWVVEYRFAGETVQQQKGSFTLIR